MRKNIVISIAMHKGGSGKSSTAANLAFALAGLGHKVLAIDTDPQMNLTRCFNLYSDKNIPPEERKNFYNAFINKEDIRGHILSTGYENLDFVMSDIALSMIEVNMASMPLRELRARSVLKPLMEDTENGYDFILIDQNPSLGLFNTSLLHASQEVLVPIESSIWGVEGLQMFFGYVKGINEHNEMLGLPGVSILGVIFNRVDQRENISEDARALVEDIFPGKVLDIYIPTDANIKKAQWKRVPLSVYNKKSKAVESYEKLAREVVKRVQGKY